MASMTPVDLLEQIMVVLRGFRPPGKYFAAGDGCPSIGADGHIDDTASAYMSAEAP